VDEEWIIVTEKTPADGQPRLHRPSEYRTDILGCQGSVVGARRTRRMRRPKSGGDLREAPIGFCVESGSTPSPCPSPSAASCLAMFFMPSGGILWSCQRKNSRGRRRCRGDSNRRGSQGRETTQAGGGARGGSESRDWRSGGGGRAGKGFLSTVVELGELGI
jgi:hypothetical protein